MDKNELNHYDDYLQGTGEVLCGVKHTYGLPMVSSEDVLNGYSEGLCASCWTIGFSVQTMLKAYREYAHHRDMIQYCHDPSGGDKIRKRMWDLAQAVEESIDGR